MKDIPVIIVEDTSISPKLYDALSCGNDTLDCGIFRFVAHPSLGTWVREYDIFHKYKELLEGKKVNQWSALQNQALVVIDLKLGCVLPNNHVEDLNKWLGTSIEGLGLTPGQEQGLYLIGVALKNTTWNGVILVATFANHNEVKNAVDKLKKNIPREDIYILVTDKITGESGIKPLMKGIREFDNRFGDPLSQFLNEMKKLSVREAHEGWGNQEVPPTFEHLANLLGYQPPELARKLGMSINPYPSSSDIVAECLKTLSTKDKQSYCFTAMGATFIAWAAYRYHFPDGDGNIKFAKAISDCRDLCESDCKKISRHSSIIVPQKSAMLKKTVRSFYEMMKSMLKADKDTVFCKQEDDLLKKVKLDQNGLSIHCKQHPDLLSTRLNKIIEELIGSLNQASSEPTEHAVCRTILKFWMQSAISDKVQFGSEQRPFLHAPLRICPAGDEPITGTVIRFEI